MDLLESGRCDLVSAISSIEGVRALPTQPGGMRCIGYALGHLLDQGWARDYDTREDHPPYFKDPLIIRTIQTLAKHGFEPIAPVSGAPAPSGSLAVLGTFYPTGFKIVTASLSQAEKISYIRAAESKRPSFVADHFGLVIESGGKILLDSKLGQGPACLMPIALAPYGQDALFFRPPARAAGAG